MPESSRRWRPVYTDCDRHSQHAADAERCSLGTGYDQVLVTGTPGTAALGGTLALQPQSDVLYVAGTNYDIVNAAGGISGAFATTTGAPSRRS